MGLAGLFAQTKSLEKYPQAQFALGGILAGIGRFLMHFLAGTFAFGVFAPEGVPDALYSFLYQAGYVLPDIAIAIVCGIALFSSKLFVKESKKFHLLDGKNKA
jgi:thiamine transporter